MQTVHLPAKDSDFLMDHMQLICDIGELNEIFIDAQSIEAFLQKIVQMVARHMHAAICSIYLYNEESRELVLTATKGLHTDSTGKVMLKLGEGLCGLSLKELKPVCEKCASQHVNFKAFPGINEEKYEAFLAVPIVRGISRIGVLAVQRQNNRPFSERDTMTLRAVASQLANMLENARLFMSVQSLPSINDDKRSTRNVKLLKGKVASEGFALGPVRVMDRDRTIDTFFHKTYDKKYTLEQFNEALGRTARQLETLQAKVEEKLSDVASLIFTAHLLLLKDKEFVGAMARKIEEGINPPEAILSIARYYVNVFNQGTNAYIREKVQDIEDLTIRLLGNLVDELTDGCKCSKHIVIARELFPSDMLKLSSEGALAVVLVTGGVTSHLSILARSLGIPLMIVDSPRPMTIADETIVLVDAEVGNLYIQPSQSVIISFEKRNEARKSIAKYKSVVKPTTETLDGTRVQLLANINLLSDVKLAHDVQCEGIGLYRTEFPFLIRSNFPSEEEQFVVYRQLVDGLPGKPITFRTLDIGGDKILSYDNSAKEQNPFLGMRSIRFSLDNKDLFRQQIRAMLRAGAGADLRISFPMISSLEELLDSKVLIAECILELNSQKIAHNNQPKIGVLLEVPSVLAIIDELACESDFFSIGTNDLVQYMLAVDRTNEKVANLYTPHHPSVLRSIKRITDAALAANIDVSICGDMAHQERYIPFFIGIGIRTLSLEPANIPRVQEIIGKVNLPQAKKIALSVLEASRSSEIAKLLK